jgi:hypothetical protein
MIAIFSMAPVVLGIVMLGEGYYPSPRTLIQVALLVGMIVLMRETFIQSIWLDRIVKLVSCVLIIYFLAINNQVLFDQKIVNHLDETLTYQIANRIEKKYGYTKINEIKSIYIDGVPKLDTVTTSRMEKNQLNAKQKYTQYMYIGSESRSIYSQHIKTPNLNMSAFNFPWSQAAIFEWTLGYRFSLPSEEENNKGALYCFSHDAWPSEAAVTVIGKMAVVCF